MGNSGNQVKIELLGESGKLTSELARSNSGIRTFGTSVKQQFAAISRTVDAASEHFGLFGTAITALSTGLLLKKMFSVRDFIPIDDALLTMQANLHMTARELQDFKSQLAGLSGKEGQDIKALFGSAANLTRAYGPGESINILKESIRGSEALTQDTAGFTDRIVHIMKMYKLGADDAKEIADSLIAARTNIEQLDIVFQRGVLKGGAGKDFKDIVAVVGALNRSGVASPRVLTAVENTITSIEKKTATLRASGIDPFKIDPKSGEKKKKTIIDLLDDFDRLIKRSEKKGIDKQKIEENFDQAMGGGAYETIRFLITQRENLNKAIQDQENASQIAAERSAVAEQKWDKQLGKIRNTIQGIKVEYSGLYDLAKKPIQAIADAPGAVKAGALGAAGLALTATGLLVGKKVGGFFGAIGKKATGLAAGKAVEAATGVNPVFVTNWPANMGGGGAVDTAIGAAGGAAAGQAGKIAAFAKWIPWAAIAAGSLTLGAITAGVTGGLTGAYAIGDSLTGGSGENWINRMADSLAKSFHEAVRLKDSERPNAGFQAREMPVSINLNIDKDLRVTAKTDDPNTRIDLPRGNFAHGH